MWLLIDNYDSFSQILLDNLRQVERNVICIQNDEKTLAEIIELAPNRIILSPGPNTPDEAGITLDVIQYFHNKIPILGVCLGHQALGQFFGAKVIKGIYPIHGKTSKIQHQKKGIFASFEEGMKVMRYHSLIIENTENTDLEVWARAEDGTIMAIGHPHFPIVGLQFHPESVLSPQGLDLLKAWDLYFRNYQFPNA